MYYFTPPQRASNCMVKHLSVLLLLLTAALVLPRAASAQCTQVITASDLTCTNNHDCVSQAGCVVTEFTATCTGWYKIDIWSECGSSAEHCYDYQACANIVDETGNNKNCHTTNCDTEDCVHNCATENQRACLQAGNVYKLYTCLIDCGNGACHSPSAGTCKAVCSLSYTGQTICP